MARLAHCPTSASRWAQAGLLQSSVPMARERAPWRGACPGLYLPMVDLVFDSLGRAREAGVSILLIEQFAHRALEFADRALILLRGELVWSGDANGALDQAARIYLGDAVQTS